MNIRDKIQEILPAWAGSTGDDGDIVLSSRIRLARNFRNYPFPHYASESQLDQILAEMEGLMAKLPKENGEYKLTRLESLSPVDRMVLVEKHLVSPRLVNKPAHRGVVLRGDEVASVMINEEDHLRIQTILPGLRLYDSLELASRLDDKIEESVDYAYNESRGYLTACPTNTGTGLRASVMLHLPTLTMVEQVKKVLAALSHLGLNVRGLYGEGTEAHGNLYQISNQVTLGQSEEELIGKILSAARQVAEHERNTREALLKESRIPLEDRLCRAYGLLSQARLITSEEAMRLLSDVRLGVDLELIPQVNAKAIRELFLLTRAAILQRLIGKELSPAERDYYRASVIRDHLNNTGKPGKSEGNNR